MSRDVHLAWSKPFTLAAFSENRVDEPLLDQSGVYLWCMKTAQGYAVVYVGKADRGFRQRLDQHVAYMRNGNYCLLSLDRSKQVFSDEDFTQAYIPGYDRLPDEERLALAPVNMAATQIMVAPLTEDDPPPEQVEGALQIHLGRNAATRKYLMTGVSNYNLHDVVISNGFPDGMHVAGMEDDIRTPTCPVE